MTSTPRSPGAKPAAKPSHKPGAKPEPVADVIASLLAEHAGLDLPVRLRAWDGSEAGPPGPPVAVIRSAQALRRILWRPGELGLARAYISGDLDVEGDLTEGLRLVLNATRQKAAPATPRTTSNRTQAALTRATAMLNRIPAAQGVQTTLAWTPAAVAAARAAARL
jgi:cyclopropane-fatty-acyl-phospholipid synthase